MQITKVFKNFHEIIIDPHKDRPEISKKGAWALSIICAVPLGIPHIISAVAISRSKNGKGENVTQKKIRSIWQKNIKSEQKVSPTPHIPKLSMHKPNIELAKDIVCFLKEIHKLHPINDVVIPDLLGLISEKLSKINSSLEDILTDPVSKQLLENDPCAKGIIKLHTTMTLVKELLLLDTLNSTPENNLKAAQNLLNLNNIQLETYINTPHLLNDLLKSEEFQKVVNIYINEDHSQKEGIKQTEIKLLKDILVNFKEKQVI